MRKSLTLTLVLGMFLWILPLAGATASGTDHPLVFHSLDAPCVAFDTRPAPTGSGDGPLVSEGATDSMAFDIVGAPIGSPDNFESQGGAPGGCGIPGFITGSPVTTAVLMNLVAINPSAGGNLRAYPTGAAGTGGIVNFQGLLPVNLNNSNAFTLPVRQDAEGDDITVEINAAAGSTVHVRGIILGYFTPAAHRAEAGLLPLSGATRPNVVGGSYDLNTIKPGVVGATIGGGGGDNADLAPGFPEFLPNRVFDHFGTIGGGLGNTVGTDDIFVGIETNATVSGGKENTASQTWSSVGGGTQNAATGPGATVGGGASNTAGSSMATVAGGQANSAVHSYSAVGGGLSNTADGQNAVIGGGESNTASGSHATIGGGDGNTAGGESSAVGGGIGNTASGPTSVVAGGELNSAPSPWGTVGGGYSNEATLPAATVAGGYGNAASGDTSAVGGGGGNESGGNWATVSGGNSNAAQGNYSAIGGGDDNTANASHSTVGGGELNTAGASWATISGGQGNDASGQYATVGGGNSGTAGGDYATVSGGLLNVSPIRLATVAGGEQNRASGEAAAIGGGYYNHALALYATIGGGGPSDLAFASLTNNRVFDNYGTIGGGGYNRVGSDDADATTAAYATVGGGEGNTASALYATIGGGRENTASDGAATVGGGAENEATGDGSTIAGGGFNSASGDSSTVPGGQDNTASGNYSFAAGSLASAEHDNSFVWNGEEWPGTANSDRDGQFKVNAPGGVWIEAESHGLAPVGLFVNASSTDDGIAIYGRSESTDTAVLAKNAGTGDIFRGLGPTSTVFTVDNDGDVTAKSFTPPSDRNVKENFASIDPTEILQAVAALPIETWNYIGDDPAVRHLGPVAQDFTAAFELGDSEVGFTTIDADGVALAAIQGLYAQVQDLEAGSTSSGGVPVLLLVLLMLGTAVVTGTTVALITLKR